MGRAKRFKILDTAIKKYKAPTTVAGTPFNVYQKFKDGNSGLSPTQPTRGAEQNWKTKPFSVPTSANQFAILGSSTRALSTSLSLTGLVLSDLAVTAVAATDTIENNPNYVPAKVIVFAGTGSNTAVAATANKVTGTAYKRRGGTSYTLPFGQDTVPGPRMYDAMGYLSDKADAGGKSVTFKPERFYGSGG